MRSLPLRAGVGVVLAVAGLGVLWEAIRRLHVGDYLAATLLMVAGICVLRIGAALLQPSIGE